jgi:serine protease
MPRLRLLCASSAVTAAVVVLWAVSGSGQSPPPAGKRALGLDGPTPIERGVSPDTSHGPGTPEALRRASIRVASAVADRAGASGVRYRPGRVIVKFKDGASAASRSSGVAAAGGGATMAPRQASQDFDIVQIPSAMDAEAIARAFRSRPDVEYAQAAYRVHAEFVPNDALYPQQWNLPAIHMDQAWDIQPAAGSNITVAVLDTGIAYTAATVPFHASAFSEDPADPNNNILPPGVGAASYPALGDLTLRFVAATELAPSTRFVKPHDFIWNDTLPLDLDGHGTHVSGTIGQLTNNRTNGLGDASNGGGTAGVAFNVKLMPVKVLDGQWDDIFGSPNAGTDDIVALGIRYAADNGANIINMSLGRTGPANCGGNPNQDGCAPVIEAAIRYAVGKGVFVAIAAGNDFAMGNPTETLAEIASRVPGAVSVGAVNQATGHSFFSSTGSYIELAAPGGEFGSFGDGGGILQQTFDLDLVDTFDGPPSKFTAPEFDALAYFFFIGTSQATPHASGVAAMLMQQGITDPAAIEAALERFAAPCSESQNRCAAGLAANRNNTFGFGLIDARKTLRGLGLAK